MTTTKHCPICGKSFVDSKHPDKIYCSNECRITSHTSKTIECTCEYCGKSFTRKQWHTKRFCSHACSLKAPRKSDPNNFKTCICEWCNKKFTTRHDTLGRFCSNQCRSEFGAHQPKPKARKPEIHIIRQCVICGKDYATTTHQVKNRGSSCCSRECAAIKISQGMVGANNVNYRGGSITYRGRNWGRQSRLALKRDGYCCQICHKRLNRKAWDYGVHHIIPYRQFNNDYETANQLSNLITLCRSCHAKVEHGHMPCPRPLI